MGFNIDYNLDNMTYQVSLNGKDVTSKTSPLVTKALEAFVSYRKVMFNLTSRWDDSCIGSRMINEGDKDSRCYLSKAITEAFNSLSKNNEESSIDRSVLEGLSVQEGIKLSQ